nr:hypothetical protein [Cryobacterium sp.]
MLDPAGRDEDLGRAGRGRFDRLGVLKVRVRAVPGIEEDLAGQGTHQSPGIFDHRLDLFNIDPDIRQLGRDDDLVTRIDGALRVVAVVE